MKHLIIFLISFCQLSSAKFSDIMRVKQVRTLEEAHGAEFFAYDFIALAQLHGYKAEEHNITTEDGYILSIFRLLPNSTSSNETEKRPAVFMMHGWIGRSEMYTFLGPGRSLAYKLLDAGYDVWLGNLRGNTNSRKHTTLSPDDAEFWDFSVDDYALVDLPTMLDYVLKFTGQQKLIHIGHSLGTTTVLMLLSEKIEYNDKLKAAILLAPVALFKTDTWQKNTLDLVGALLLLFVPRTYEFIYLNVAIPWSFKYLCPLNRVLMAFCKSIFALFFGTDEEQFNLEEEPEALIYYISGCSMKTAYHLKQLMDTEEFQHYDYYFESYNKQVYGSDKPPYYNLSRVTTPIVIFRGEKDDFSTEEGTKAFTSRLPKDTFVSDNVVEWDKFDHGDFYLAKDVDKLLNSKVLEAMEKFR